MDFEEHFVKEERIVFSLMEELHRDGNVTPELTRLIEELDSEHKVVGDLIKLHQEANMISRCRKMGVATIPSHT